MWWYPFSLEVACGMTLLAVVNTHVVAVRAISALDPLWYWPPKVEAEDNSGIVFDFNEEACRRHYTLKVAA